MMDSRSWPPRRAVVPCTGARNAPARTPHWTSAVADLPGHRSPPGAQGAGGSRYSRQAAEKKVQYKDLKSAPREGYRGNHGAAVGVAKLVPIVRTTAFVALVSELQATGYPVAGNTYTLGSYSGTMRMATSPVGMLWQPSRTFGPWRLMRERIFCSQSVRGFRFSMPSRTSMLQVPHEQWPPHTLVIVTA